MQIIVDVDDVCANLVEEWIRRYNFDYGDNLKKSSIIEWDISKFIKEPKNKEFLYQYIEDPLLYENMAQIKDSLWGIKKLKSMGNRVIFVTSSTIGCAGKKYLWLRKNGYIETKKDYYEGDDKSVFRGHWIIDDRPLNVRSFNGRAIMFNQPWNKNEQWDLKCKDWKHVIKTISSIGEFGYL